jgi:3-deoxy-D-manno-octulosonic-acid transferase
MRLYPALLSALYLAAYPWLARRYREGFDERRGLYGPSFPRDLQRPLWVHAVSVGEVQSASPLLRVIRGDEPERGLLLSTVTVTGRQMARRLLEEIIDGHVYYPWDVPWIVRRALERIDPGLYCAVETEIWPGLLEELRRRRVPAFLVNGRLSDRSFRRMSRWPAFWRRAYGLFEKILVRADDDLDRFRSLGIAADKLELIGDLKIDALLDRHRNVSLGPVRELLCGKGPLFVAGSTHEGEESIVIEAFSLLRREIPTARLVLAPRHPERAPALMERIGEAPFSSCLLSQRRAGWDILVVDQVGLLFELYGLAESAFVGGSLVPRGGQNLLEPACWNLPLCHGPHMEDFSLAAADLKEVGVARTVVDGPSLARFWKDSLDGNLRRSVAKRAQAFFDTRGGAASRAWRFMKPYLENRR